MKIKLDKVYNHPIKDVVEKMSLVDVKVHSNDAGEVCAIELKYVAATEKEAAPLHPYA